LPAAPRTVIGFHFYLMQADIVPAPRAGILGRMLWPWSVAAEEHPAGSHPAERCDEEGHARLGCQRASEAPPPSRQFEEGRCEEDSVTGQPKLVVGAPLLGRAEEAAGAWPRPRYGPARKRLLRSFSCLAE
jgi:hypothetical protein